MQHIRKRRLSAKVEVRVFGFKIFDKEPKLFSRCPLPNMGREYIEQA
jgi:hypothetical protein